MKYSVDFFAKQAVADRCRDHALAGKVDTFQGVHRRISAAPSAAVYVEDTWAQLPIARILREEDVHFQIEAIDRFVNENLRSLRESIPLTVRKGGDVLLGGRDDRRICGEHGLECGEPFCGHLIGTHAVRVDVVGDGIGFPIEALRLIDDRHVESFSERFDPVVELRDIGIFRKLSGGDHLGEKDFHLRVVLAGEGDHFLGGPEDSGNRFFLYGVVVTGVDQDDISGKFGVKVFVLGEHLFRALSTVAAVGKAALVDLGPDKYRFDPRIGELLGEHGPIDLERASALSDRVPEAEDADFRRVRENRGEY